MLYRRTKRLSLFRFVHLHCSDEENPSSYCKRLKGTLKTEQCCVVASEPRTPYLIADVHEPAVACCQQQPQIKGRDALVSMANHHACFCQTERGLYM